MTQRIEQEFASGDHLKVQSILSERDNAEAMYYIAASNYAGAHAELLKVVGALEFAIDEEARAIEVSDKADAIAAMGNCIGAWHSLKELTGYVEDKWRHSDTEGALKSLDFDVAAYIAG